MPNFHKILAHRSSCFALYRALLTHTKHLPYPVGLNNHTRNAIKKGFRKGRIIQGLSNIRAALKEAYEMESLFRGAATGNSAQKDTLLSRINSHIQLKQSQKALSQAPPRPPPTFPPPTPPTTRRSRLVLQAARTDPTIRARRQRHIAIHLRSTPHLSQSSSFPVLRLPGRRQSTAMSMTIKRLTQKRQQRVDLGEVLETHVAVAVDEDAWDDVVESVVGRIAGGREGGGGSLWVAEAEGAYKEVKRRVRAAEDRAVGLARKFEGIIDAVETKRKDAVREYKREKRRRLRRAKREREEGKQQKRKQKDKSRR